MGEKRRGLFVCRGVFLNFVEVFGSDFVVISVGKFVYKR